MFELKVQPVKPPVDHDAALRELYAIARHQGQVLRDEGIFDGQHRFSLLNRLDRHVVEQIATISEVR